MEAPLYAQKYSMQSPDGHIALTISNQEQLTYQVQLDGKTLIAPSPMGFQLKDEKEMKGNFIVENDAKVKSGIESWIPVVRNKHAECKVPCQELTLNLKENGDQYRRMDVVFRVMNDGVVLKLGKTDKIMSKSLGKTEGIQCFCIGKTDKMHPFNITIVR